MSIVRYKDALLNAIQRYEAEHGHHLSARRRKDVAELKAIIQNEVDLRVMKRELLARIAKIQTGWWIFKTGKSDLKKYLLQVIHAPAYALDKVLTEELASLEQKWQQRCSQERIQHEKAFNALQAKNNDLMAKMEEQQKILEKQASRKERTYFTYEDYLINLLDKFTNRLLLSEIESLHLNEILNAAKSQFEGMQLDQPQTFMEKIAKACEFSFNILVKGIGYLIQEKALDKPTFSCIAKFADYYGYSLKTNSDTQLPLHQQINQLLLSYYKDGADKTLICHLSLPHKTTILETKENLINLYGDKTQTQVLALLSELRLALRFEDFKKLCIKKGKELDEWLPKKNKPKASLAAKKENACTFEPANSTETHLATAQVKLTVN